MVHGRLHAIHPIQCSYPKPRPRHRLRSSKSSPTHGHMAGFRLTRPTRSSSQQQHGSYDRKHKVAGCPFIANDTICTTHQTNPRYHAPLAEDHGSYFQPPCVLRPVRTTLRAHLEHTPPKPQADVPTNTTLVQVPYDSITVTALARHQGVNG